MTCRELAELLVDFVANELPTDHRDSVAKHLGECPPCVAYLDTYRLTIQLTRQLPPVPMPPQCEQRLRDAVSKMTR